MPYLCKRQEKLAMSLGKFSTRKALPWFFRCVFSSLTCLKKRVFRKGALLRWKVPASLSLFREKIPALLYVGKLPWFLTCYRGLPASGRFQIEPADDYMSRVKHLRFFFLWIFWTLARLKMAQITAQLIRITSGWQKVLARLAK